MRKIRLDAEQLEVLSFPTAPDAPARGGTVLANATAHPCYVTVAYQDTLCLAYPVSYWGEQTCTCPAVPYTQDPIRCLNTLRLTC